MTEEQKDQRRYALAISGGVCEVCGQPLGANAQAAHRIGNTKANRERYGSLVIDHRYNVGYVCSLKCNAVLDISSEPRKVLELIQRIYTVEALRYNNSI